MRSRRADGPVETVPRRLDPGARPRGLEALRARADRRHPVCPPALPAVGSSSSIVARESSATGATAVPTTAHASVTPRAAARRLVLPARAPHVPPGRYAATRTAASTEPPPLAGTARSASSAGRTKSARVALASATRAPSSHSPSAPRDATTCPRIRRIAGAAAPIAREGRPVLAVPVRACRAVWIAGPGAWTSPRARCIAGRARPRVPPRKIVWARPACASRGSRTAVASASTCRSTTPTAACAGTPAPVYTSVRAEFASERRAPRRSPRQSLRDPEPAVASFPSGGAPCGGVRVPSRSALARAFSAHVTSSRVHFCGGAPDPDPLTTPSRRWPRPRRASPR